VGPNHLAKIHNGEVVRTINGIPDGYIFHVEAIHNFLVKIIEFVSLNQHLHNMIDEIIIS
jgi:hypothetical protein